MIRHRGILLTLLLAVASSVYGTTEPARWLRPTDPNGALVWGRSDGIVFGIPSPGGMKGPRGLIRVGVLGTTGATELINYIAIEPVAKGSGDRFKRMAFSELEPSQMDAGKDGKRLWVDNVAGTLTTGPEERLSVRIEVEPFSSNKTHVYLIATMYASRPDELELAVHHHEDSAPVEELTLTATMGNYERLRQLWLKGETIDSRKLYADYTGNDFIEKHSYPLDKLLRTKTGDAIVLATPNEPDPSSVTVNAKPWWTYRSVRLTQYWRVAADQVQPDLRARVNGRRVYWLSHSEIPGGIAFENFEVRQRYVPGQKSVFGLTTKEPGEFTPAIPGLPQRPR